MPFEDFVDDQGMDPAERERLRRVHELLLEAGPPPALTASLSKLPAGVTRPRVMEFPARRRLAFALAFAAALAAAAFGGGYLVGNTGSSGGFGTVRVAAMTGRNALGSVTVGTPDASGNWPIKFRTTGLPQLAGKDSYYELFVVHAGRPGFPCGGFKVHGPGTTSATFTVPYEVTGTTRWVLTAVDRSDRWPGRVVLT